MRKAGNQVRITAQLILAADGVHLWSETWDRTLDDVFAVQDEIAADVADELEITLLGQAPTSTAVDPEAYALFLQARRSGRLGSAEGDEEAVRFYEQALAIDPEYAAAWDGLARAYSNQAGTTRPKQEAFGLAREAAEKALAIDPDYAPVHGRLGWIAMRSDGDLAAARHFQRALELDSHDIDLISNSASLLSELGRWDPR